MSADSGSPIMDRALVLIQDLALALEARGIRDGEELHLVNRARRFVALPALDVGLSPPTATETEPKLNDACRCGHTFGHHCTPEFPNGGYCAVSDTASPGYGCSCVAFVAAGGSVAVPAPPGMTLEYANELDAKIARLIAEAEAAQEELERVLVALETRPAAVAVPAPQTRNETQ